MLFSDKTATRSSGRALSLALLALCAAVACLYSVSLGHNFFFDEENIILYNPSIKDLSQWTQLFNRGYFSALNPGEDMLWGHYYRPLTLLTFALNYAVMGVDPFIYNLTNMFFHIGVCVLLFLLLRRMVDSTLAAFLAALLYAAHPMHTEAVTYIASRGDLMAAFFLLLAILLYAKQRWVAVFVCYVASFLCKESGVLLPIYLLLFDFCFVKTKWRPLILRFAPFLVAGIAYILFRKYWCPVPLAPAVWDPQASLLRVLSMGPAILSYIDMLFLPEEFKYCASINFAQKFSDPQVFVTLAVLALFLVAIMLAFRYRGPVFFGLCLLVISIGPNCQWVRIMPDWAEHYLYIPSIGLVIVLAAWMVRLLRMKKQIQATLLVLAYIPFLGFLSYRTFHRNQLYNNDMEFYARLGRSDSPYAHYGYNSMAGILTSHGMWDEAAVYLRAVLAMHPDSELNTFNMGLYYATKGKNDKAIPLFKEAYRLGPNQPIYLVHAVVLLYQEKRYDEALAELQRLEPQMEDEWMYYKNLVRIYEFSGKPKEALAAAERGLEKVKNTPDQKATVLCEIILLAYRQGWNDVYDKYLNELWANYRDLRWYGPIAAVLKKEISVETYLNQIENEYGETAKSAWPYVLTVYSKEGQRDKIKAFLDKNGADIEARTGDKQLIAAIFDKARSV